MLYGFSVTPMAADHFEQRVADIVDMYKRGVIDMPLFCMTLVPEGNPVWDKAGKMCEIYARYRDALDAEGVPSGILVQASLGHGYAITPNPFERYVNLTDGTSVNVCCPEDGEFIKHFSSVMRRLASERPKAIMLDDDFRLMMRPGKGCACKRHMEIFNSLAGTDMTREELYSHLISHDKSDRLSRIYQRTQRESLMKAAEAFRAAIDEVDPTIQGINCTSGHVCESVQYTNKIFAGKGNPTMVRVPNGIYAPITVRGFSDIMRQAAICSSKLKKNGIDIILSETDTIPFNRYAKSARYLHSHYAVSMLDGLKGAKHWLTRTSAFEPLSGKAYRDILAKHKGMYEALAELSEGISWVGCGSAFVEQEDVDFSGAGYGSRSHDNYWISDNIERMGLPFYFSENGERAIFLEGDIVGDMSDEHIRELFSGSVFCDGQSAMELCKRGYGDLLGVNVSEWDLGTISGEIFDMQGSPTCTKQKGALKLTPTNSSTEALSYNYLRCDDGPKLLAPAVTKLTREGGRLSVVFSGSPHAPFSYGEGFAFLNETRKAQLVSLLGEAGALPVYAVGDDEICMRAGKLVGGELLVAIFLLGYDPVDALTLHLDKKPEEVEAMLPDGSWTMVGYTESADKVYTLDIGADPMYPVIIRIKESK